MTASRRLSHLCGQRRYLHARWVKHSHRVMSDQPSTSLPRVAGLPARGLLMQSSPLLPALWALGNVQKDACPAAQLVRALWHRHEPQEPLRCTRNRSLPGSLLAEDPELLGHVFGMALTGVSDAEGVQVLRSLGVGPLARRTKVSLSRFARLAGLVRDGLGGGGTLPPALCTSSIMLAFLWASASSKDDLLRFLEAAATHLPHGALLHPEHAEAGAEWRREWLSQSYGVSEAEDGTVTAIAAASSLAADPHPPPESLELLAFAMASRGSERPLVEQARHSYLGQKAVPDCVEAVARDAISLALWDPDRSCFDPSRLPPTADPALHRYFEGRLAYSSGRSAGGAFFDLCSDRTHQPEPLRYMSGGTLGDYELHPSVDNLIAALRSMLGPSFSPPVNDVLHEMWPGARAVWDVRRNQHTDRAALRLKALPGGTSGAATRRTEELTLIFANNVHCYALRRVEGDGPLWLTGVRRAWLGRWRSHGAAGNGLVSDGLGDGLDSDSGGLGAEGVAATCVLAEQLLHARAHLVANTEQHGSFGTNEEACEPSVDIATAVLAVLAATPHGYEERTAGLTVLLSAGQSAWWALPLLLQPPPATGRWDSLTLGSCADLLAPAVAARRIHEPTAAAALCAAAGASPALQAVVALKVDDHDLLAAALARCADDEAALVLRVALGFTGFSLAQRSRALVAVGTSWWKQQRAMRSPALPLDPVFH